MVSAAVFNLGYLPGGNKQIITRGITTIRAVQNILPHLLDGGIIVLVIYFGHPGGTDERQTVADFARKLSQKQYDVLKYEFINQNNTPPELIAIQKK